VGFLTRTGVLALACAALVAGCGGDDDASPNPDETTPADIRNAVFERAFSECGSESIEELAGKHNVDPNSADVSTAVGEFWAGEFGGREDAVREGKIGCLQSISLETPGQTNTKPKQKTSTQP
jgi:hypothetical protein